jgi:hypothetical protein
LIEAWLGQLTSQPRATQLISKDHSLLSNLEEALSRYLKDIRRTTFRADKRSVSMTRFLSFMQCISYCHLHGEYHLFNFFLLQNSYLLKSWKGKIYPILKKFLDHLHLFAKRFLKNLPNMIVEVCSSSVKVLNFLTNVDF